MELYQGADSAHCRGGKKNLWKGVRMYLGITALGLALFRTGNLY
jgi:hypothetical protein